MPRGRGRRTNARAMARRRRQMRRNNRRGLSSRALTTVNRSLQPFPNRYICKMKYSTNVTTDAVTGQYVFNLNSLYDPDRTGIGHQPYGYDNLALLYNRYRVISCGWRIVQPAGGFQGPATMIAAIPNNDLSIVYVDAGQMCENPRTKYVIQNPGGAITPLKGKSYIPTLVGRTKAQYMADDHYQSVVTTSPIELALLYVQSFSPSSGAVAPGVAIQVVLEYTVEFFDVKHVVQS